MRPTVVDVVVVVVVDDVDVNFFSLSSFLKQI